MKLYNILPTKFRRGVASAIVVLPFFLSMAGGAQALEPTENDYELKLLGKYLFFDKISVPSRQSCASCHTPDAGWTNGTSGTNQKQVAVTGANPHIPLAPLNHPATPMRALFRISLLAGLGPEGETSGTVAPREMRWLAY